MSDAELDNKIRLNQARREAAEKNAQEAKNKAKASNKGILRKVGPVAAMGAAKDAMLAFTAFKLKDVFIYGIALVLAFFKDLLDIAVIGALPGIGTVITWMISGSIALLLMFDGVSGAKKRLAGRMIKRMLVLIAGTIVEGFLFGLNFFPFEMATVGLIYFLTLMERKQEKRINNDNDKEEYED